MKSNITKMHGQQHIKKNHAELFRHSELVIAVDTCALHCHTVHETLACDPLWNTQAGVCFQNYMANRLW